MSEDYLLRNESLPFSPQKLTFRAAEAYLLRGKSLPFAKPCFLIRRGIGLYPLHIPSPPACAAAVIGPTGRWGRPDGVQMPSAERIPDSLSSISSEFLLHEDIADVLDKIKKEYGEQFGNNRKIFFELICSSINAYRFIDNVVTEDAIYSDIQKLTFLENLYSDIFSASMMHPYYLAFIPFCINEVLKYEV